MKNQYGLDRTIPDSVRREVRQRCGFGCVVCGGSIVDYEHVDPPFAQARRHDPAAIALLCPTCHGRVTRNFMSKSRVRAAMANPKCKQQGFSFGEFDPAHTHPFVVFAGMTLINCAIPVQVQGIPVFQIEEPEAEGAPYRLSATFYDQRGVPSLLIRRNDWRASAAPWDVEVAGGRITIRSAPGAISLRLAFAPAAGIVIEVLDMFVAGWRLVGNKDTLAITQPGGGTGYFTNCLASNCHVGLALG